MQLVLVMAAQRVTLGAISAAMARGRRRPVAASRGEADRMA
jgi:hypothetical protein